MYWRSVKKRRAPPGCRPTGLWLQKRPDPVAVEAGSGLLEEYSHHPHRPVKPCPPTRAYYIPLTAQAKELWQTPLPLMLHSLDSG